MGKTAVGLYETAQEARQVLDELTSAGFSRNNIRIMVGDRESRRIRDWEWEGGTANPPARDGDAHRVLERVGVPHSDAVYYEEALHRGRALLSVSTTDQRIDEAVDIMARRPLIDLEDRVRRWRAEGWTEPTRTRTTREGDGDRTIPVVEEEMRVGKRQIERSGVRIHAHVVETPVEETVRLRDETISVDRQRVDRPASSADLDAFRDETIEVRETDEEAVVDKQARVVEEVRVHKDVETREETVRDTVRRTDVDVEQAGTTTTGMGDWDRYRTEFRTHYNTNYANTGYGFEVYEPAYLYGYTLATTPEYRGRRWSEIEPEVRRRWEAEDRNRGTWDRFKGAIQHAWSRATT